MTSAKEEKKEMEKELDEELAKMQDQKESLSDFHAFAWSHLLYCIVRNYDGKGYGKNWEKDSLLTDVIKQSIDYLSKFAICQENLLKAQTIMNSKRKYRT